MRTSRTNPSNRLSSVNPLTVKRERIIQRRLQPRIAFLSLIRRRPGIFPACAESLILHPLLPENRWWLQVVGAVFEFRSQLAQRRHLLENIHAFLDVLRIEDETRQTQPLQRREIGHIRLADVET